MIPLKFIKNERGPQLCFFEIIVLIIYQEVDLHMVFQIYP